MPSVDMPILSSRPSGRHVDFDHAEIRQVAGSSFLFVRGRLTLANQSVRLAPRSYSHQPDYWEIDVIATSAQSRSNTDHVNDNMVHYERSMPLEAVIGRKGLEIIGNPTHQKIDYPGAED